MSYTKAGIYNLTFSALLLGKEVTEISTDTSNEVRILNIHWDTAFESTLQDLDLDSLSDDLELELIDTLDQGPWTYVYKYPTNCIFFRRIKSCAAVDNSSTHISKKVGIYEGQRAIFTNVEGAIAEVIPKNVPLAALNPMAALAVAYKLALLSAPLLTGKGAKALKDDIRGEYLIAKGEAQEIDMRENFNYEADSVRSEFVRERLS